jgi:hypothetical protein
VPPGLSEYDTLATCALAFALEREGRALLVGDSGCKSVVYERDDYWASTTNKHLNFVQHVKGPLAIHGRAAVDEADGPRRLRA